MSQTITHTPTLDYHWVVRHKDGSILRQFNEDGSENSFKDIDQKNLNEFHLIPSMQGTLKGLKSFVLHLDPSQKLIYRRRNYIRSDGERWLVYVLGWQVLSIWQRFKRMLVKPKREMIYKGKKFILFICPDGTTHISEDFELM